MKVIKYLGYLVAIFVVAIVGYVCFLWASTIHDTMTEGEKYGFSIETTKKEAFSDVLLLRVEYPNLAIYSYVEVELQAQSQLIDLNFQYDDLKHYDQWRLNLNGKRKYNNSIRLNFKDDKLISLYRHRQFYELP